MAIVLSENKKNLEHDLEIIKKMLAITHKLTGENIHENLHDSFIQLGKLAFDIKHDKNDIHCIRNQFGVYSDEAGKPREERYRAHGIPFQGLFFIGKWLEKNKKIIDELALRNWVIQHQRDFVQLNNKLACIPTTEIGHEELTFIQQFSECVNDLMHLEVALESLSAFDVQDLDLSDPHARYALARIYSVLGEVGKSLSNNITGSPHFGFLKDLGKCRDLVKLPFVMPKTAQRMHAAKEFLKLHGKQLYSLFEFMHKQILEELHDKKMDFTDGYRTWFASQLENNFHPEKFVLNISTQIQTIKTGFKDAKNTERNSDENVIDNDIDEVQDEVEDPKMASALRMIAGYQKMCSDSQLVKNKHKTKCIEEYRKLYLSLDNNNGTLPNPTHQDLMAYALNNDLIVNKQQAKKPKISKLKLLKKNTGAVEHVYAMLNKIDPESSEISRFAYAQCVSFLGQLFIEISLLHRLVLLEPTVSVWDQDFVQTIQIRHQRLMHNVVNYDAQIVKEFVQNSVMPWQENFLEFNIIAKWKSYVEDKTSSNSAATTVLSESKPELSYGFFNFLGLAYAHLHQWNEAEYYYLAAYHSIQNRDQNDPDFDNDAIARIMHNLADCSRALGNWEKTTQWMERIWEHRKTHLPEEHSYYISTRIHLGMCYEHLRRRQEALACYQHALEISLKHDLKKFQSDALRNLISFYMDEADYLQAFIYAEQNSAIVDDKKGDLYSLDLLEELAIQCGDHEKALHYYQKKSTLFHDNKPYFKSNLGFDYSSFEEKMIGPIYILDIMGRDKDALELINLVQVPTFEQQVLKLRLLRNLNRFDEAKDFGSKILKQAEAGKVSDEFLLFTCKVIYSNVLLGLDINSEAGLALLKSLCLEAIDLRNRNGNAVLFSVLSPFNILSEYYRATKQFDEAKHVITQLLDLIGDMKILTLSYEVCANLISAYKAYISSNDIAGMRQKMHSYEPLVVKYLKRVHPENAYNTYENLIDLLIESDCLDIASKFLDALVTDKNMVGSDVPYNFTRLYLSLAGKHVESGDPDAGIRILYSFLLNYCLEEDKRYCSFYLAKILNNHNKITLLKRVIINYKQYWNDGFDVGNEALLDILRNISNFSFRCSNDAVNQVAKDGNKNAFKEASQHMQYCIRLAPKIHNLIEQEDIKNKSELKIELFKQYWRAAFAIYEFEEINVLILPQLLRLISQHEIIMSAQDAININIAYFGGELNVNVSSVNPVKATVVIPAHWKAFLSEFKIFIMPYIKSGQKTQLTMLIVPVQMNPREPIPEPLKLSAAQNNNYNDNPQTIPAPLIPLPEDCNNIGSSILYWWHLTARDETLEEHTKTQIAINEFLTIQRKNK